MTALLLAICTSAPARGEVIDGTMHHLRAGSEREWDDFPERAESDQLRVTFNARANDIEKSLKLRHRDLRHVWRVLLNDQEVAKLPQDENPMVSLIALPARALREGANVLQIVCAENKPEADDIMIGDIELLDSPRKTVLSQAWLEVSVIDGDTTHPLPCRLTIVDAKGDLVPLGIESDATLAVRPGVVYTSNGQAALRLAAGRYTLYAGRGFEWGIDSIQLDLQPGANDARRLTVRREVNTAGYVASDTHIHTFTYSRHGDATLAERMITLAGEGIELPIATDHNLNIDYEEAAAASKVRQFFTPVVGNEVTTPKLGHFNVFPLEKSDKLIDFRAPTWEKLFANIDSIAPGAVIILNHARDLHGGFRPFDPLHHIARTGEELDGRTLRANGMEVINSGATLNDPLLLYRDWMGCLNRGLRLTPVGASDSHDVTRFIVGQGRTYIRADDNDPGNIDVKRACEAMKRGEVLVSYGLLADIKVNGRFGPGDLASVDGELEVQVNVQGPAWTRADRIELYANGTKIRQATIDPEAGARPGVKASVTWKLPKPSHDVYLTAIATGPGVTQPHWPGAKPYQRMSAHWVPYVLGCTGAVFLDADSSGSFQSAFDYGARIINAATDDVPKTIAALTPYDASVAAQAASILRTRQKLEDPQSAQTAARSAPEHVREGFEAFARSWRESDAARAAKTKE